MITSYNDYIIYRKSESTTSNDFIKHIVFPNITQCFIKWLRRVEWHYNSKGLLHKLLFVVSYYFFNKASIRAGFSIPKNVFDIGLSIPHYGSIVVNANCSIGKNCRLHNNVNIGASGGNAKAPKIGDNVYIGPGAVIFGDIVIADNCYIGANSVVNKSFLEPYSVIAGVPAKVVKIAKKSWNE